jgi:hypothetical protein
MIVEHKRMLFVMALCKLHVYGPIGKVAQNEFANVTSNIIILVMANVSFVFIVDTTSAVKTPPPKECEKPEDLRKGLRLSKFNMWAEINQVKPIVEECITKQQWPKKLRFVV